MLLLINGRVVGVNDETGEVYMDIKATPQLVAQAKKSAN